MLCKCGCGEETNNPSGYVRYHHLRGRSPWNKDIPCREETKTRISVTLTGRSLTEEHKNNIGLGKIGIPIGVGKILTEEHIRNIGIGVRKAVSEGRRVQKGCVPWNKGLTYTVCPMTEERKHNISLSKLNHIVTKETQLKISISLTGHVESEESKRKNSATHKLTFSNPDVLKALSIKRLAMWKDPVYRENQILSMKGCQNKRPNNPETVIHLITQEYFTGWKYTGDYSIVIAGKNPDFVNEETKQIIEVYGDFWHEGEDPTIKAELYYQAGYELCVIWEHELQNLDEVILKLRRFCSRDF